MLKLTSGIVVSLALFLSATGTCLAGIPGAKPAQAADHYFSFGYHTGERVNDIAFKDIDGVSSLLSKPGTPLGTVVAIRDAECPVSQRYAPRLAELEQLYRAKGFGFVYIDVTPYTAKEARENMRGYHLEGRIVQDPGKKLIGALRALSSTEVFVIDAAGTLRYRGGIDDQFGIGVSKDKPEHAWLQNALDEIVAGHSVSVDTTAAPGCMFDTDPDAAGKARAVTYHNRISRIVQKKCEVCHRVDGLAPMPLQNYSQVYERRMIINYMTSNHLMPPWTASAAVGKWVNDASLSERDLKDLLDWIKAGAPEGKKSDAPLAKKYLPGWTMEKPDAILQIPESFKVPAQGVMSYKYAYLKTDFDSDKWVSAIEIRPTAPRVVHHVLFFVEEPGRKNYNDPSRKPGEPLPNFGADGFFGGVSPGTQMMVFPEGSAKKLPKGAWLKFQIHYTPNGTEQTDQTQIALKFVDAPADASKPIREVVTGSAYRGDFVIPAGDADYQTSSEYEFKKPGILVTLAPHAHLRCKAWKVWLAGKDGSKTLLLDVPKFNFNWMTYYQFKEPVRVEPGMKLISTAWYDNSSANPFNPDPTIAVHWGEQTFEEMMIDYFDWIPD